MTNKELIKHLEHATPDSVVMFITEGGIYEVLTVAYVAGDKDDATEFHVGLNKVGEIISIGEDNTYE